MRHHGRPGFPIRFAMTPDEQNPYRSPTTDPTHPKSVDPDDVMPLGAMRFMKWACYLLSSLLFLVAGTLLVGYVAGYIPPGWGRLWKYAALAGAGLFFVGRSGYRDDWG